MKIFLRIIVLTLVVSNVIGQIKSNEVDLIKSSPFIDAKYYLDKKSKKTVKIKAKKALKKRQVKNKTSIASSPFIFSTANEKNQKQAKPSLNDLKNRIEKLKKKASAIKIKVNRPKKKTNIKKHIKQKPLKKKKAAAYTKGRKSQASSKINKEVKSSPKKKRQPRKNLYLRARLKVDNAKIREVRKIDNDVEFTAKDISQKSDSVLVPIRIKDLIRDVVRRNASALFKYLQTKINENQVEYERSILDAKFSFSAKKKNVNQQNDIAEALSRNFTTEYRDSTEIYELGYSGMTAQGAEWSVKMSYDRQGSSIIDRYRNFGHENTSGMDLMMKYPLAKGKGKDITLIKVEIAKLNKNISVDQYKKQLMDVIGLTIQNYWRLYGAQQLYNSWLKSLLITEKSLKDTKLRVKNGLAPQTEVLEIESGISSRKIQLTDLRSKIIRLQNQIFNLLNISVRDNSKVLLRAVETPDIYDIDVPKLEDSFQKAIGNWPEFKIAKRKVELEKLKLKYAENQKLPDLDLVGNVYSSNLDQSASDVLGRMMSDRHLSYYLGVEYSIPVHNRAARSNYEIEKLRLKQAELELVTLERTLGNGLYDKIDQLKTMQEQLLEYQRGMKIRSSLVDIARKQMSLGKIRVRRLFDQEEKQIEFQRKLLNGIVDVKLSEAALDKAVGTLLERFDVNVTEIVPVTVPGPPALDVGIKNVK
jgi:outer membrane protein TolC/predicted XRE-type DNA-binding protein